MGIVLTPSVLLLVVGTAFIAGAATALYSAVRFLKWKQSTFG